MRLGIGADSSKRASNSPGTLGNYELLDEIARGGMGVVYRARQVALNRQVAVKVLPGGQFVDPDFRERFRREAQAAASLNHPNIVAIHEVGEAEEQLYFSMELIDGQSLAQLSNGHPLPHRDAAELLRKIAEAVHFAHERGVIHRDLKPSNVLVDEFGEPHITDFGLAKRVDTDGELTVTGQILGSPNYMAPEQADPGLGPITPATDVYSLGAMLYHLLTGRPPFLASTVAQTLHLLASGSPVSPRLLQPDISRDLETICLKCLERDPRERYQAAAELAEELERFLQDRPIIARPASPILKLARWCQRKPALAGSLAVAAILLLVIAIGSPIALVRIRGEREASEATRRQEALLRVRSEAAESQARRQLYSALVEQAHASVRSGEIGQRLQALDAIRRAAAISNSLELRREAIAALALSDLRFERQLRAGPEFTMKLPDPAFERVALCRGAGPIEIRSLSDWRLLATLPASTNLPAYVARWTLDGRYLAIKRDYSFTGKRADLEVWDTSKQKRVLTIRGMLNNALAFDSLHARLLVAQADEGLISWDLERREKIATFHVSGTPERIDFAPNGKRFVVAADAAGRAQISVYNYETSALESEAILADAVGDLAWQPGGEWIAIADYGGMIHLINPRNGQTHLLGSHKAQAVSVTFSPDGGHLLSGGWEGELICWNMNTLQRSFTAARQSWTALFRSDGIECAILTPSGIELHAFERPSQREFAEDLGRRLRHAAFSNDGRLLAASADQYVGLWDLTRPEPGVLAKQKLEGRLFFSSDGKKLFANSEVECSAWSVAQNTNTPLRLEALEIPMREKLNSICLSSNLIAYTGENGSAIAPMDVKDATELHWNNTIRGINRISNDKQWLGIYRPFSTSLYIYHLPEMQLAVKLRNRAYISDFHFTPSGREIAVSSRNGIEFWNTNSWTHTQVLTNATGILFSPDGSGWWLTSDFRNAGLYKAGTAEPLLPLPAGVLPIALSADGRQLAVSTNFRYLQVWNVTELRARLAELGLTWD